MRGYAVLPAVLLALVSLGCSDGTAPLSWTPSMDGLWVSTGAYLKPRYLPGDPYGLGGALEVGPVALEVAGSNWQLTSTGGPQSWCDPDCAWTVAGTLTYSNNPCGTDTVDSTCAFDITFFRGTRSVPVPVRIVRNRSTQPATQYVTLAFLDTAGIGEVLALFGVPLPDFTVDGVWCCTEGDVVGLQVHLLKEE